MPQSLNTLLNQAPYQAYTYSYPHKTAYRAFEPSLPLRDVWQNEQLSQLFLYLHVPFCSYRCGFCNLFAIANPTDDMVTNYVQQLKTQLNVTMQTLKQLAIEKNETVRFHRFALGGGTPSFLSSAQLHELLSHVHTTTGVNLHNIPAGIEVSPETVNAEKMQLCADVGIDRVSMGVQSFHAQEVKNLARPQQPETVKNAITTIRDAGIATLNLDLIYGIAGQTVASFLASLQSTLAFAPEEIYLYPLYVREQTGLDKRQRNPRTSADKQRVIARSLDLRLEMYQEGRDFLLANGYVQTSMRMFKRTANTKKDDVHVPEYTCQEDGMVGIGCGARSYTQSVHYAHEYGVSRNSVQDILQHYLSLSAQEFAQVNFGYQLDGEEQRRRYVIQSLMLLQGLDLADYVTRFGRDCVDDLPELHDLLDLSLAYKKYDKLLLTEHGMARADTIGPWLISPTVRQKMQDYEFS